MQNHEERRGGGQRESKRGNEESDGDLINSVTSSFFFVSFPLPLPPRLLFNGCIST
jgi:hypothetical protein